MPLGLFKKINDNLNRKISLAFLLSWIFGVLFAFIGLISVFSDPVSAFSLLMVSALLISPISNFIEKKIKTKLTKKIKTIIIIICIAAFGATTDTKSQTSNTIIKNTLPKKQEQPIVTSATQKTANKTNPEQIVAESEKTETNPAPVQINNDTQNTQPQEEQTEYYAVTKVVDGDTIDVNINGTTERLRLIGIDTPEVVDPRKPVECFGREASKKASEILLNQKVRLESDPTQNDRDKYNRLLRYVYREDGLFYNKWIIENGYAHEYTYVIPYKFQTEFQQAESYARKNKLGLWGPDACNDEEQATTTENQLDTTNLSVGTSNNQTGLVTQENGEASGHIFYTSRYFTSKLYYCDTDPVWKDLSEKYLESYPSEGELLKEFPTKTLHELCK